MVIEFVTLNLDGNSIETVVIELVCLGFDLACFTFFYNLYDRKKKNIQAIKVAPVLELDTDVKSKVAEYKNALVPYAIVRGTVQSKDIALRSNFVPNITGVIKKVTVKEYKIMWNPISRFWSEVESDIRVSVNDVPFFLQNDSLWQKVSIEVEEPLIAEGIPLATTHDQFIPASQSFTSNVLGWLRGERSKGFQEIETMLVKGTLLTGIGQVSLENDDLILKPPSNGLSYYLTNMSCEALTKRLNSDMKLFRMLSIVTGCLGIFLVYLVTKSLYAKWKQNLQRINDARRREEIRRTRPGNTNITSDSRANVPRCVVCLTNSIEIVILECGHACLCVDCTDRIVANGLCPVCRSEIVRTVPAYLP